MNGSPIPEAIGERDSEGGQLGLALQDLEAGFGAELEQLEVAAAATAAGRPAAAAQVLDLASLEAEQTHRLDDLEHPVTAYLNSLAPSSGDLSSRLWTGSPAVRRSSARLRPCPGTGSAARMCSGSGVCSRSTIRPPPPTACSPRCARCSKSAGKPSC